MAYTVLDFETTGLDYLTEQVIEIGAIKVDKDFNEIGRFHTMVKLTEGKKLKPFITELTGITEKDTQTGLSEVTALNMLKDFIGNTIVVAQHAPFDLSFLAKAMEPEMFLDTRSISRIINPNAKAGLKDLCERYGVELEHHRSISDAEATVKVLQIMLDEIRNHEFYAVKMMPIASVVVKSPDRDLNFIPLSAVVIDLDVIKEYHNKQPIEVEVAGE